ncbi:precorrin-6A synthase (deacetylating) [Halotalea alkalilenta]|uniref:precorrin-6A synthase (deacetylating) n=1 Tax=Halotalea alkalilenta TaxID=376489 RepID=UPI00047FA0AC|nr:precorrin-6A synthase (deacetylating) [Halotalea alkalilenta]
MRALDLIGIGAGDPRHLTLQAVEALGRLDLVVLIDKRAETAELTLMREAILDRFASPRLERLHLDDPPRRREGDYAANVEAWHTARAELLEDALRSHLQDGQRAGLLAWGEPTLFDSALRLIRTIQMRGSIELEVEVIPGISSVQALAARHRIPLNRINEPVHITTGRKLAAGFPPGLDAVLVMLDGDCTFLQVAEPGMEIFWGAYLGTEDEILIEGLVGEVGQRIVELRAAARARKGWIMDTYLLRRR